MATKPKSRRAPVTRQGKRKASKKVAQRVSRPKNVIKKTKRAKLVKPQTRDVRQLRSQYSKLKKLGLIKTKRSAAKIKANDSAAKKLVQKFADVLSGNAKPLKVSRSDAKKFKKMGFQTTEDKVILPTEPGVKLQSKGGKVFRVKELKNGEIRSQVLPVPFENLRKWIEKVSSDPALEAMKPKGAKWAFRMYGNNSFATFADLDLMMQYLDNYKSVTEAITNKDRKKQREIFQNLEIVTVKTKTWAADRPKKRRRTNATGRSEGSRENVREYDRKYRERLKSRYPKRYAALLEHDAERKRAERRAMRKSPKKLAEYRRKARERWQRNKHNRPRG